VGGAYKRKVGERRSGVKEGGVRSRGGSRAEKKGQDVDVLFGKRRREKGEVRGVRKLGGESGDGEVKEDEMGANGGGMWRRKSEGGVK